MLKWKFQKDSLCPVFVIEEDTVEDVFLCKHLLVREKWHQILNKFKMWLED